MALRGVGAVGISTAASVVGAAKDHSCKGTQDVLVMKRSFACVVYVRCSLLLANIIKHHSPCTSAQQARIGPPLACAGEAVASEARLAGA